jgi:hypothetical protein
MYPARCGFVVSLSGTFGTHPMVITVQPNPEFPDAWNKDHHRRQFASLARKFNAIVVIGEAEDAHLIFAPNGKTFSRDDYPILFKDGGRRIGLPETEFVGPPLTMSEIAQRLFAA